MIDIRWLAIPNRGCIHFPRSIWRLYDYLIHYQIEDSHAL